MTLGTNISYSNIQTFVAGNQRFSQLNIDSMTLLMEKRCDFQPEMQDLAVL